MNEKEKDIYVPLYINAVHVHYIALSLDSDRDIPFGRNM